ncbi:hypothetical protein A5675_19395 [Mycobacterium malmoense]|uniref:Uncharacterized protein n=2 Tax=Mycobacterium malmoense TaxID=1780 RepID=A0A1B9CYR5_MYCMA|nr:hypothetical protein A5674_11405 [Mycobacterium malmoense]OCB32661.1 hypothetical protein A5676_05190 [Mycobacterium malmoense]OCB35076.1 hypothetical protein A5675_19395 [Mycobacterium malmoense]OCB47852.1 hypothetical protein A5677_25960 [Mycobacterium malmoense]
MHPTPTRPARSRVPMTIAIAVVVLLAVLAVPVKQRCGAPGLSCATAVDPRGNVHYYYEVEPFGVYVAEVITGSNITVYYDSGEDLVNAR